MSFELFIGNFRTLSAFINSQYAHLYEDRRFRAAGCCRAGKGRCAKYLVLLWPLAMLLASPVSIVLWRGNGLQP